MNIYVYQLYKYLSKDNRHIILQTKPAFYLITSLETSSEELELSELSELSELFLELEVLLSEPLLLELFFPSVS
jgi:hypothetical protein